MNCGYEADDEGYNVVEKKKNCFKSITLSPCARISLRKRRHRKFYTHCPSRKDSDGESYGSNLLEGRPSKCRRNDTRTNGKQSEEHHTNYRPFENLSNSCPDENRQVRHSDALTCNNALQLQKKNGIQQCGPLPIEKALTISQRARLLVESSRPYRVVHSNAAYESFRLECNPQNSIIRNQSVFSELDFENILCVAKALFGERHVIVYPVKGSLATGIMPTHYLLELHPDALPSPVTGASTILSVIG